MDWHDPTCKKPDLADLGGLRSCLRCGSFEDAASSASTIAKSTIYTPIRQRFDIRILRIRPGDFKDPIDSELFIEDISNDPEYEAISYTWADEDGNADKCRTITVNDRAFSVTTNCEAALRRVRYRYNTRRVWIDAICIDQSNDDERGHQVQLMSQIFQKALQVFVYVGESDRPNDRCQPACWDLNAPKYYPLPTYQKLSQLVKRRYFTRLWILQEVALARRALVVWGSQVLLWDRCVEICKGERLELPPVMRFDRRLYSEPNQLLHLLDLALGCQAADSHDRIYALLGILVYAPTSGIVVDYHLTAEQLYAQVAILAASACGWSAVLARAVNTVQSSNFVRSWIPDWGATGLKWSLAGGSGPYSRPKLVTTPAGPRTLDREAFYHYIVEALIETPSMKDAASGNLVFNSVIFDEDLKSLVLGLHNGCNHELLHDTGCFYGHYVCFWDGSPLHAFISHESSTKPIPRYSTQILAIEVESLSNEVYAFKNVEFPLYEDGTAPSNLIPDLCSISLSFLSSYLTTLNAQDSMKLMGAMKVGYTSSTPYQFYQERWDPKGDATAMELTTLLAEFGGLTDPPSSKGLFPLPINPHRGPLIDQSLDISNFVESGEQSHSKL
ncbi:putative Heterokaryon incompatibility domain-containing protein [Seiridium cardinale]